MPTDTDPRPEGAPQPFRRPMTWGRPPQAVFRAGPLPKGSRLAPLPEPPNPATRLSPRPSATPTGSAFFSGSMIPTAPAPRPGPTSAPVPPPRPSAPDLSVRPLPPPEPEETVVEAEPASGPTPRPAVVGHPASVTPLRAKTANRAPLYLAVTAVAVAILGVGGWLLTRSPAGPAASATPVTVAPPGPAAPVESSSARPVTLTPAPVGTGATAPPRSAPIAESRPAARPATAAPPPAVVEPPVIESPVIEAPPPAITPAPLIEIAPTAPPPTAAEAPPSDPSAPIRTRPQPVG